ncbi:hypothetical protein VTH06DRAFT_5748 [Thermothelomyces fergusii]
MGENGKRKDAPGGGGEHKSKKKKTGNGGKWKTPHQQAKELSQDAHPQPGDTGIWITCARHQEAKAAREIEVLFSEYAEKMYGVKSVHDTQPAGDGGGSEGGSEDDDIEAAIRKEVAALNAKPSVAAATSRPGETGNSINDNRMTPLKMNVDCLLFVKTRPPIDPVAFVRRICEDARRCEEVPGLMRCRYVNRLTPMTVMGKASENGLVEVARQALGQWFDLSGKKKASGGGEDEKKTASAVAEEQSEAVTAQAGEKEGEGSANPERRPFTFAIRPTIRNHSNLKRDVVINTIAGLINDDLHKVNLTSPDKVILVDIYQTICGMSVVDGDWDALRRYNLTELYSQGRNADAHPSKD